MKALRRSACAAGLSLLLASSALAQSSSVGPATPDQMAAHFIDVGQGAAVLLEFSCGAALIDTGGQADRYFDSNAKLLAYLNAFFARRTDLNRTLDVVFLTHAHKDHTTGALRLVPTDGSPPPFVIRNVVTNAETAGSGIRGQKALLDYARANSIPSLQVTTAAVPHPFGLQTAVTDPIACPVTSPVLRVLWGSSHTGASWQNDGNNQSLAIRLDFGQSTFLFLGDLEDTAHSKLIEAWADNPVILDVGVYHAPHHGSKNGTTAALVKAESPEIAVISSGDPSKRQYGFTAHDFGHPNLKAIQILEDPVFGVTTARAVKHVAVGLNGKSPDGKVKARYSHADVSRGIYDTAWDGDIVIEASTSGAKTVVLN